jgi:predicted Zn-dependent peptidase
MGGMNGIIFQEIREARALAYTAYGEYKEAERSGEKGQILVWAGTRADKAVETATLLRDLLLAPPVSSQRLDAARKQVLGELLSEDIPFRYVPHQVLKWQRQGWRSDPRPRLLGKVNLYARKDLDRLLKFIRASPLTFYVIGDRARLDLEGLKGLGEFEQRAIEEIFPVKQYRRN